MGGLLHRLALVAVLAVVLTSCGDDTGSSNSQAGGKALKARNHPQCGDYYGSIRYRSDSETGFDRCQAEIDFYCEYGSVSRAQLRGCEKNVTWGEVKNADTNAGRFGRFELHECLADAGPFCRDREQQFIE